MRCSAQAPHKLNILCVLDVLCYSLTVLWSTYASSVYCSPTCWDPDICSLKAFDICWWSADISNGQSTLCLYCSPCDPFHGHPSAIIWIKSTTELSSRKSDSSLAPVHTPRATYCTINHPVESYIAITLII